MRGKVLGKKTKVILSVQVARISRSLALKTFPWGF